VFRVDVLLEGELSLQSEVLSTLEHVFTNNLIFASILTSLSIPATENHSHSMMLPPPCFTVGMVLCFLQTWRLAFRPENLVSHGLRVFRCLLANSKRVVMCLLLRSGFHLA
jgi:hypothetical protein